MYCIYYNKEWDLAILADDKLEDLGITLYNISTLRNDFINKKLEIKNFSERTFIKEDIKAEKLNNSKMRFIFNKVCIYDEFPLVIRLNNTSKYILMEKDNDKLVLSICDLEFIKECTDIKTFTLVSNKQIQERGLGKNEDRDKDTRRDKYKDIRAIQARDCRGASNISVCIQEIKEGDPKERTNIELETENRVDNKPNDLQIDSSKPEETNLLDFGDDEDEIVEEFKPIYTEYDPNCTICHGTGRILDHGFIQECLCGERIARLKELNAQRERIKPLFKVTNAIKENVVSYGLIPEEYKDIEYDDKIIQKIISQKYKGRKVKVQNYNSFANTLSTIIASCKTGQKLKHSYLLGGDKGFGKKTFVYTCLKYLYARNNPLLCKYISLSELGLLKAEAIKRASAINNLGYYTRDNDKELVQRTIIEESKKAMNGILNEWFNTVKETGGLKTALKAFGYKIDTDLSIDEQKEELKKQKLMLGKKFEDVIINNAYTRIAEEERIVNYGSEYCGRLVNTWEDYINAPIVFVHFSGIGERRFETEVLQILLNIRGAKALPTIAIIETSTDIFKDEAMFIEDNAGIVSTEVFKARSYFWDNMLSDVSDTGKKADKGKLKEEISSNIEYDRMIHVSSYARYQDKLKVGVDI